MELYFVYLVPFADTNVTLLHADQTDIHGKDQHLAEEANESGCVGSLLLFSQSCEYKKLRKNVREALSIGKFIPSDIVSMMNAIIAWQALNREQMGRLKYECNKLIDCYVDSSSDEAESTNFEEEVITKFLLGHF